MTTLETRPANTQVSQSFNLLRLGFTVLPILFGLDKFTGLMLDHWEKYLASPFNDLLPGNGHQGMYIIGAIEIVAGLVVYFAPKFGGLLVAVWLLGIIVNLAIIGGYWDVALRDFGLLAAALTLSRLADGVGVRGVVTKPYVD